jgi:hypothetical protein
MNKLHTLMLRIFNTPLVIKHNFHKIVLKLTLNIQ